VDGLANPMAGEAQDVVMSLMGSMLPGRGGEGPIRLALVAYKILPDGHKELLQKVAIQGATIASFKDAVSTSTRSLFHSSPFVIMGHSMFSISAGGLPAEMEASI